MAKTQDIEERFWSKVNFFGPTPQHAPDIGNCWVWKAGKDKNGYGKFSGTAERRHARAHRTSWEIHFGSIPSGLGVLHHCDNPSCVRPAHLWIGTNADNSRDMVRKGRSPTGVRHGSYLHPESRARGDRNGARLYPERLMRGDMNGSRCHPERLRRGDNHPARCRPGYLKRGSENPASILTEVDVCDIIELRKAGQSLTAIARAKGTCRSNVANIVYRRSWRHLDIPPA